MSTGQRKTSFLAKDWNKLRNELRADGLTLGSFKRKTFKYLQEQDKTQHKINVYCSLIPFIFFYTFFIVIISLSAILLVRSLTIVFFLILKYFITGHRFIPAVFLYFSDLFLQFK